MNQSIKKIGCMILSTIIGVSAMPVSIYAREEHPTEKNETIYTVLHGDGSVDSTIVSSWLHDDDGIQNIQENLNLQNVENVKTDEEPSVQGQTYTWNAKGNDVYYQGESKQALPVQISIEYTLDGQRISAKDLEGKSGHLEVSMHFTPMYSKVVHGITIHPSYVLAGGMVLDDETMQNVSSMQGQIVDDGNRKMFVFATVPGMQQTLQEAGLAQVSDQFHITDCIEWQADVTNFSQSDCMMAMSNEFSMEDLPTFQSASNIQMLLSASHALLDGTRQLKEGTSMLQEGVKPFESVYPQMDALSQGMHQLYQGSGVLKQSVQQYTYGVSKLHEGSHSFYDLAKGADQLYTSEGDLVAGIEQLEAGLSQLESKTSSVDLQCLDQVAAILKKDQEVFAAMQEQMKLAHRTLDGLQVVMAQLACEIQTMNQTAAMNNETAKAYKLSQQKAIDAIDQSIATLQSLESSDEVDGAIASLQQQRQELVSLQEQMEFKLFDPSSMLQLSQSIQTALLPFDQMMKDTNETLAGLEKDLQDVQKLASQAGSINVAELQGAIHRLNAGAKSLKAGSLALNQGLKVLKEQTQNGADSIYSSSKLLNDKGVELVQGAEQLESGLQEADSKKEQLESLKGGLMALNDAIDQLSSGSQKLYEGQSAFYSQVELSVSELEMLQSIMQSMQAFNKEVNVFAGTPEGSIHTSRFVFRIEE